MKYIIPKNYNYKNKLLGFIDYPTIIFDIILLLFFYCFFNLLFPKLLTIKIILIIIFYMPILLFSIIGFNHENFIYILFYIIKFLLKPKLYLYK